MTLADLFLSFIFNICTLKIASELRQGSLVRHDFPGMFKKSSSFDVILKEPRKLSWKDLFLEKYSATWVIEIARSSCTEVS